MTLEYYEIPDNFAPVINIAKALLSGREHNDICEMLNNATISVINTDYNDWNGGTYGYTVYISISVKQYTATPSSQINEIEDEVAKALNEATKDDDRNYFNVKISPIITKNDIDWKIIGGEQTKYELRRDIETIRNIMVSVATGGNRIQQEEVRYQQLQTQVTSKLKKLNIPYSNTYSSLWDWYGKWRADFPTYQERRQYIKDLFMPTINFLDDATPNNEMITFVELDDWDRIKRTVSKIQRDSTTACNEEDYQSIGLLCREVIISLAQVVYSPTLHGSIDDNGVEIGKTDSVRMIGNYIQFKLSGKENEELRAYAKNTNKLANLLTHKRNATKKDVLLAVSSTIALINFIGIIEEKY